MVAEHSLTSSINIKSASSAATTTASFGSEAFDSVSAGTVVNRVLTKPTIQKLSSGITTTALQQQQVVDKNRKIKQFSSEFYRIIEHDHFEFGVTSNVERYVDTWIARDLQTTQLGLAQIFYDNQMVEKVAIGILKIIAHIEPDVLSPTNRGIAMTALGLPSVEVRECAVRAYEYWEDPAIVTDLVLRTLEPSWLEDYKQTVIAEVRG